jgi:hypothetical protein
LNAPTQPRKPCSRPTAIIRCDQIFAVSIIFLLPPILLERIVCNGPHQPGRPDLLAFATAGTALWPLFALFLIRRHLSTGFGMGAVR